MRNPTPALCAFLLTALLFTSCEVSSTAPICGTGSTPLDTSTITGSWKMIKWHDDSYTNICELKVFESGSNLMCSLHDARSTGTNLVRAVNISTNHYISYGSDTRWMLFQLRFTPNTNTIELQQASPNEAADALCQNMLQGTNRTFPTGGRSIALRSSSTSLVAFVASQTNFFSGLKFLFQRTL